MFFMLLFLAIMIVMLAVGFTIRIKETDSAFVRFIKNIVKIIFVGVSIVFLAAFLMALFSGNI